MNRELHVRTRHKHAGVVLGDQGLHNMQMKDKCGCSSD